MYINFKKFLSSIFLEDFSNDELILKNIWLLKENLYQTLLFSTNIILITMILLIYYTYKNLYSFSNFPIIPISILLVAIQLFQISQQLINSTNKKIKIDEFKFYQIIIQVIITTIFIIIILYVIQLLIYTDMYFLDRTILLQVFQGNQHCFIHSYKINCILICLIELMLISQTQYYLNRMTELDGSIALVKHISQHFFNFSILLITIIRQTVFHTIRNEQLERIQINQKTLHDIRNYLQSFQYFQQEQSEKKLSSELINQNTSNENQSMNDIKNKESLINQNEFEKEINKDKTNELILKTNLGTINRDNYTQNMNEIIFKFIMQKCEYLYQLDLICELKQHTKLINIEVKSLLDNSIDILKILFQNKHIGFQIILNSEINSILIDTNVFNQILAEIIENLYLKYDQYFSVEIIIAQFEKCNKLLIKIPQTDNISDIFASKILSKKLDCLTDITIQNIQIDSEKICLDIDLINIENKIIQNKSNENKEIINNQKENMKLLQKQSSQGSIQKNNLKQKIEELQLIGKNITKEKYPDHVVKDNNSFFDQFKNFDQKAQSLEDQSEYLYQNETEQLIDDKIIFINVDDENNILKMNSRVCSKYNLALNKIKDRDNFLRLLGKIYQDKNVDDKFECKVIVFMDHMLYRDQGQDVINSANDFNKFLSLDVTQILLSSTEDSQTLTMQKDLKVEHFVTKPLNFFKLEQVLKDLGIFKSKNDSRD